MTDALQILRKGLERLQRRPVIRLYKRTIARLEKQDGA